MSTLFVNTIKPDSGSNVLISSSLTISESLKVAGDFELSGSIKLGNADTDSVGFIADVSSSIIPDIDEEFNLGATNKRWKRIYAKRIITSANISSSGTIIAEKIKVDNLDLANQTFTSITASGTVTATEFFGDGSNLTGIGISGSAIDALNITASGISMSQGDIIGGTSSLAHLNMISGNAIFNAVAIGTSSVSGGAGLHIFSETDPTLILEGDSEGAIDEVKMQWRSRGYDGASGNIWSVGVGAIGDDGNGTGGANKHLFFTQNASLTGSVPSLVLQRNNKAGINTSQPTVALQVEGSVSASGTGSFRHLAINGMVSGAVSSSGTGSFEGGIDSIEATGSFGYISSSGDISASGTGSFEFLTVTSEIIGNVSASGTGSFQGGIDCIGDGLGMSPASGAFGFISTSGDIFVNGTINLSASGDISTVRTASFNHVIVDAGAADRIALSASGDIRLDTGSFFVGDGRLLTNITTSTSPGGASTQVQFNDGGSLAGDAGFVYNKTTNNLSVSGSITIGAGPPASNFEGHVSASGTGSFGGGVDAAGATGSFGYISCSGDISSSGLGFFVNGVETEGGATSSFGYISCSGEITVSGLIGVDGDISASGTISGSLIKGQSVQAQVGDNLGFRFNLNDNSQVNAIRYKTIGERAHLQIPSLPTSITLPFSASSTALVGGNLTVGGTATIAGTTTHNGVLNAANGFRIGGVAVTATAAELNKMDGFIGTTTQLNTLIKSAAGEIEANKSVEYDDDGAIKRREPKRVTGVTLTPADSGTTLMPNADSAQTFILPIPTSGVIFNFIAASAQAHVLRLPTGVNQFNGFLIDYNRAVESGDDPSSPSVTSIVNRGAITLVNPRIGDNIQCISDGDRWYVRGYTNNTVALANV